MENFFVQWQPLLRIEIEQDSFSVSFPKFSETSFRENFCLANSVIYVLAVFLVY